MKNNTMLLLLPISLLLDLLIPFLLAPSYKGYHHLTQVMSILGNTKAPLHTVYNVWLVVFGCILVINSFGIYKIISKHSTLIAAIFLIAVLIYAIGGCILSGIFSVGETKSLVSFSQKMHGYGSVIGFTLLTITPLLLSLYGFKAEKIAFAVGSLLCFILTLITFTLFIMADKPNYQNTMIAYEGLWQRLSLMFMYIPIACIYFVR